MILKAFILGLSTGGFCMGYCAPVLIGLLFSRQEQQWIGNLKSLGLFLAGRLIAYLLFGVISFLLGEMFKGNLIFLSLFPIGETLLGGLMLMYAIRMNFPHWQFCHHALKWSESRWTLFAAGIFTGMNLCPPFILAVGTAMRSGSLFNSLVFFFFFFIATSLYLLPFAFTNLASRSENIRSAARIVCGLTGAWLILSGLKKFLS